MKKILDRVLKCPPERQADVVHVVELMGERGAVAPDAAVPMEVPVKAVVHVITCDDPMRYTGTILRAAEFVQENHL